MFVEKREVKYVDQFAKLSNVELVQLLEREARLLLEDQRAQAATTMETAIVVHVARSRHLRCGAEGSEACSGRSDGLLGIVEQSHEVGSRGGASSRARRAAFGRVLRGPLSRRSGYEPAAKTGWIGRK